MGYRVAVLFLLLVFGVVLPLVVDVPEVKAVPIEVMRTFTSLNYDGAIEWYAATYGDARNATTGSVDDATNAASIGQMKTGAAAVFRGFFFFDTSILPSSPNITSAILSIYVSSDTSNQDFNITIQNGLPTYPHVPLEVGDYYLIHYSGDGGNRNTTTIGGVGYWNITLNSIGEGWVSDSSITKLCLRSSRDINNQEPAFAVFEYIRVYTYEQGSSYAPILYVTYETEGYRYLVHGAYYEDGTTSNCITNLTLQIQNMNPISYILNTTDATIDTLDIQIEQQGIAFLWNVSSPTFNQSRTYYLTDATFEEIWIHIPKPTDIFNQYTFTVTDLVGVSDAYIETVKSVGTNNRIIERQTLEIINNIPFWMVWASRYDIRITCDRGTYTWGAFIPSSQQTQDLIITSGLFPTTPSGLNVNVTATRMNSTWIQINYTDNQYLTIWLKVTIKHRVGGTYTTDYSTNNTGNTQQINWYSADNETDYLVVAQAKRTTTLTWTFTLPQLEPSNVWDGAFDWMGTWPIPAKNVVAMLLLLCCIGVFSYYSVAVGCVATWIFACVLFAIEWFTVSVPLLGVAGFLSAIVAIQEGKRTEREI